MRKILFLDIDGVLNCITTTQRYRSSSMYGIDPEKVALLNQVLERTGAKVVISSTWRLLTPELELTTYLRNQGFRGEIVGMTPDDERTGFRGNEIKRWLEADGKTGLYAVVDDSSDFYPDQPRVRTTWKEGLMPEHVEELVQLLTIEAPL